MSISMVASAMTATPIVGAELPYIPLNGSSPLTFLFMAGLMGIGFGFFLERSGFGSAKMLTAVFIMRDWQVYRVMFTALLTAMIGTQVLSAVGLLEFHLLEINTTYLAPMFFGGLLFGVGFYFGGFCPGTAVVSAVRGRLDAVVFLFGIVFGIYGFALLFDNAEAGSWFQNFYLPKDAAVQTLNGDAPGWIWAIGVTIGVLLSFRYLYILEQRLGMLTPAQLKSAEKRPPVKRPAPGWPEKLSIGLIGSLVVFLGLLQIGASEDEALAIGSEIPAVVAVDAESVETVDSLSLVGWMILDAHREVEEAPPNAHILDLREQPERDRTPIRGALTLPDGMMAERHDAAVALLDEVLDEADKNKPLVVVDHVDSSAGRDLVVDLRVQGLNAMLLEGGSEAWNEVVLSGDHAWPGWVVSENASKESSPIPSVADYQDQVREWMMGSSEKIPAYISIPGTVQLPSEAATVAATGGGGGGCG